MNVSLLEETLLAQIRIWIFNIKALTYKFELPFAFPQRVESVRMSPECKAEACLWMQKQLCMCVLPSPSGRCSIFSCYVMIQFFNYRDFYSG